MFAKMMSLDQMHGAVMETANSQLKLLSTNVQIIGQTMGDTLLPQVTSFSKRLADAAGATANYINTHEMAKKYIKPALEGAGGLAAGAVAVGAVGSAWATMKIMGAAFRKGAL